MKLDAHTFGQTPAAIYLANHLNEIGDPRIARKVQKALSNVRKVLNELYDSHRLKALSVSSLGSVIELISNRTKTTNEQRLIYNDELTENLVDNIIAGEIKSFKRRIQRAIKDNDTLAKKYKVDPKPWDISISHVTDPINPGQLIVKSKKKLRRLNKVDTLY